MWRICSTVCEDKVQVYFNGFSQGHIQTNYSQKAKISFFIKGVGMERKENMTAE
jgi:hypothetical protein